MASGSVSARVSACVSLCLIWCFEGWSDVIWWMCLERQTSKSLIENWDSVEMMLLIFTLLASSIWKSVPLREMGEEVMREQQWGQRSTEKMSSGGGWGAEVAKVGEKGFLRLGYAVKWGLKDEHYGNIIGKKRLSFGAQCMLWAWTYKTGNHKANEGSQLREQPF